MKWPIKSFHASSLGSNIYVIFSEVGVIVIDASSPEDPAFRPVIPYLRKVLSSNPRQKTVYLFLTHSHCRHARAAIKFKEKIPSVEILAHDDATAQLDDISLAVGNHSGKSFHCDHVINGFEKFSFGNYTLYAFPLAGHCEGHLSFLLHNLDGTTSSYDQKYLFSGDLLLKYGLPPYSMEDSSVSKLVHSLRRASDLDFLMAFPGHGPALSRRQFVATAALALIDLIIREKNVLDYLTVPRSTEEICHYVFDWLLRTGEDFQSCTIMTLHHLMKLQTERRIQTEQGMWISLENQTR